ncbi:MAG: aminodeoxychorismate synthase, component I [Gammaproteobacteria bacterium]|nr:MAG: aminodeoxychorismate synthase, component I [Gammaproteobacteria bacterium]
MLSTPDELSSSAGEATSRIPALHLFNRYNNQRYPYLLSSSALLKNNTQYDILIACPQYLLTLHSDKSLSCSDDTIELASNFLDSLELLYQQNKTESTSLTVSESGDIPYTGGWFVYLSYEMAEEVETCLSLPSLPKNQPMAVAARCPAAIIYDRKNNQCIAVAETDYAYLLDELEHDYRTVSCDNSNVLSDALIAEKIVLRTLVEADEKPYLQQVKKIKQYIIEGDIFQANLSRLWQASLKQDIDDAALFFTLAKHNPSSFAALACMPEMTIISSSPERLVSLKEGIVETRPIAGTRPRGSDQTNDDALARELLSHPKEQAEHIMLIDLERNDLGRVCTPGSIEVNELMVLESWQHVHHIVSNVRGELKPGVSPIDVLRAVFPGGTITGCPKVHCIEILAEMEQQARGAYTGSLGYINNDGSMDFNILIRTIVREGDKLTFRAGGGIVSDSIAEKELEETRAKAKGLLKIFQ